MDLKRVQANKDKLAKDMKPFEVTVLNKFLELLEKKQLKAGDTSDIQLYLNSANKMILITPAAISIVDEIKKNLQSLLDQPKADMATETKRDVRTVATETKHSILSATQPEVDVPEDFKLSNVEELRRHIQSTAAIPTENLADEEQPAAAANLVDTVASSAPETVTEQQHSVTNKEPRPRKPPKHFTFPTSRTSVSTSSVSSSDTSSQSFADTNSRNTDIDQASRSPTIRIESSFFGSAGESPIKGDKIKDEELKTPAAPPSTPENTSTLSSTTSKKR